MGKKLTIDFVKDSFESEDYILKSDIYVGNKSKLISICPKGHIYNISWFNWNLGNRCNICNGGIRFDIDDIRKSIEAEGYQLLSEEYVNCKKSLILRCCNGHEYNSNLISWNNGVRCQICKNNDHNDLIMSEIRNSMASEGYTLNSDTYTIVLECTCPNNHQHKTTVDNWKKGHRCPSCKKVAKPSIEFIKKDFELHGYTLNTEQYINCRQKLLYTCPNGHNHSVTWSNWKLGKRCYHCNQDKKVKINTVRKSFNDQNYVLHTDHIVNNKQYLHFTCPNGHDHKIKWNDWMDGHRCMLCAKNARLNFEDIKKSFENVGYKLLSTSYKRNIKLDYICSNGHKHSVKYNDWKTGSRCPICHQLNITGSGNPSWKGGVSFEPYCEIWKDNQYKDDIKIRDGYKCLNPYCSSNKPDDLTIHHIDYNKKNCKPTNLITICRSCNAKANTDRDWHTSWYQAIIYRRYLTNIK